MFAWNLCLDTRLPSTAPISNEYAAKCLQVADTCMYLLGVGVGVRGVVGVRVRGGIGVGVRPRCVLDRTAIAGAGVSCIPVTTAAAYAPFK